MGDAGDHWVPFNFLALPEEQSNLEGARVVVLPVPYDSTTSFKTGAREGPRAIIEASYGLEDYDHELGVDVAQVGIHTAPWLEPHMEGPRHMVDRVRAAVRPFVEAGKMVVLLGGEHTISIGSVGALAETQPELSVLYLDAHGDLRSQYMGTEWGHASVARRLCEICPVTQVGVRSLCIEEREFIEGGGVNTTFWPPPGSWSGRDLDGTRPSYLADIIGGLSQNVYVSVDLDVFDPSIMAAVGTPEPGGMGWYEVTGLLRAVAEERNIVGFDITELSPGLGPPACAYTAAKLAYKLVAYTNCLSWQKEPSAGGYRIS